MQQLKPTTLARLVTSINHLLLGKDQISSGPKVEQINVGVVYQKSSCNLNPPSILDPLIEIS